MSTIVSPESHQSLSRVLGTP